MPVTEAQVNTIHVGAGTLAITRGQDTVTYAASQQGGTLNYERSLEYVEIDEIPGRLAAYINGETAYLEINAVEIEAELLREAMGHGEVETTAADAQNAAFDELTFGGSVTIEELAVTYTVPRRHDPSLNIIITLHRAVAEVSIDPQFSRGGGKTTYRVRLTGLLDMSKDAGERLGSIVIETAPPTE